MIEFDISQIDPDKLGLRKRDYSILVVEKNPQHFEKIEKSLLKLNPNLRIYRADLLQEVQDLVTHQSYDLILGTTQKTPSGLLNIEQNLTFLRQIASSGNLERLVLLGKDEEDDRFILHAKEVTTDSSHSGRDESVGYSVDVLDKVEQIFGRIDLKTLRALSGAVQNATSERRILNHAAQHPVVKDIYFDTYLRGRLDFLDASRDGLTGLLNKKPFRKSLDEAYQRITAQQFGRLLDDMLRYKRGAPMPNRFEYPLSVIFIDLDGFKPINDSHGHTKADFILGLIGYLLSQKDVPAVRQGEAQRGTIQTLVRSSDEVARYGGDEFAVYMPDCPLSVALKRADHICKTLTDIDYGKMSGWGSTEPVHIGISAGVVSYAVPLNSVDYLSFVNAERANSRELIIQADEAMYAAKAKNRLLREAFEKKDTDIETFFSGALTDAIKLVAPSLLGSNEPTLRRYTIYTQTSDGTVIDYSEYE